MSPTRSFIGLEIVGKSLPELKRNPSSHDADTVNRVNQRFGVSSQNVAFGDLNHRKDLFQ
jgi:hypothetical protein